MGLADRDYTNQQNSNESYTNRSYDVNIEYTKDVSNIIRGSGLFCEYCRKEIEIKLVKEKQTRSKIEKGLVIDEIIEIIVERKNSLICSTCGGIFCPECIESYYKDRDRLVLTNTCKKCKERNCKHKYVKQFIRKDKYFDYYEIECLYCGYKKGIAEPIEKIKHEPEIKFKQEGKPQTKPKSENKGISRILKSVKRTFR
jgi:hypothetical protein